jgi:glutamate-1-semialdehyde 2,1-aminomutase
MPAANWSVIDYDREIFQRELNSFVPDRIFDAHGHLYAFSQFRDDKAPEWLRGGPPVADFAAFRKWMDMIHPGRECDGLLFPYPHLSLDTDEANRFVASEVRSHPSSRAQMLITPSMDPEFVRETVLREKFAGLKCYHIYAHGHSGPTWEADIECYLPEAHVRIAHEEGLSVTLHMVKARAMADPANQATIRRYCEKYPNLRLILAHAARGFNPHHTIEGIGALAGLGNVWCDTSAVTDAGAFEAIIQTLGVSRLLYGADFPVTHLRSRCVAIGDSFLWLTAENTKLEATYAAIELTLVAIESLRALKIACRSSRLTDREIEAVFYENAAELYGLRRGSSQL